MKEAPNLSSLAWWRYSRAILLGVVLGLMAEWTLEGAKAFPNDVQRTAYFDWDSRTGFKSFRIGGLMGPIIAVQTKRRLASCLRDGGWRSARGWTDVPVFPILVPVAFSPCMCPGRIEDPEETPLMHAAAKGDLSSVRRLLVAGADVHARDQSGKTALIHACAHSSVTATIVRALLDAGADVNAVDRFGQSCLSLVLGGQPGEPGNTNTETLRTVVRELLSADANVNQQMQELPPAIRTPFLQAVTMGDVGLVEAMLAAGANVKRDGAVALATAQSKGFTDIAELLRRAGIEQ